MEGGGVEEMDAFCTRAQAPEEEASSGLVNCWQWCKFIPALVLLVPLRMVMCLITLFNMWLTCLISDCWHCSRCQSTSTGNGGDTTIVAHTKLQRILLRMNGMWARLFLFWCGVLWISVRGTPGKAKGFLAAPTVVSNHVNMFDGWVLCYLLSGQLTGVAVAWVKDVPILGTVARAHHLLLVQIPKPTKAAQIAPVLDAEVDPPARRKGGATEVIMGYQRQRTSNLELLPLVMFPEGTTKSQRYLLRFRSGAFVSREPVQPVVLSYPHRYVDTSWVNSQSLAKHAMICLTQWVNWVEVEWLDVQPPSAADQEPKLYAHEVQRSMAKAMGLERDRYSTTVSNTEVASWISRCKAAE